MGNPKNGPGSWSGDTCSANKDLVINGKTTGSDLFTLLKVTAGKTYVVNLKPTSWWEAVLYVLDDCKNKKVLGYSDKPNNSAEQVTFTAKTSA